MKILVANGKMVGLGGSETHTYALARELIRRGHEVSVWAHDWGNLFGLPIVDTPEARYDLILLGQGAKGQGCAEVLAGVRGFKVWTCHGPREGLELPPPGMDAYVAVSEETRDVCQAAGVSARIVRNGVNCDRFRPAEPLPYRPQRVLCLCRGGAARVKVQKACSAGGLAYQVAEGVWEIEERMQASDIVVGLGRAAIEAMACGRAVMVYDERDYYPVPMRVGDGMVTPRTIAKIRTHNFSGRAFGWSLSRHDILEELASYSAGMGEWNRSYALRHFDIRQQAAKYLALMEAS